MEGRGLRIMQSNGGAIEVDKAAQQAARLVLSGPAGGVVGAFGLACQATETDKPRILTFDMGGTSTDVALCPGRIPRSAEGAITGLPIRFPSTDIHTVGAGGGSLAKVDAAGVLRVGPESAGARPGPACYGRGGRQATVTDANLVLGRLDADGFLGGSGELDAEAAHEALGALAEDLEAGMKPEIAALGVIRVANAAMERALRQVSVEQGHDPRGYTLVPFGGAGSLHACDLAEALGMERVLIPLYPGVLSALGLLMADALYDASTAIVTTSRHLREHPDILLEKIEALSKEVRQMLGDDVALTASLDVRYAGQSYELETELSLPFTSGSLVETEAAFHERHAQRFGYARPEETVEVVTLRLRGRQPGAPVDLPAISQAVTSADAALLKTKPVWFSEKGPTPTPCYTRSELRAGHELDGPAIVLQYDTTIVIPPHWKGRIDAWGNVWIEAVKSNKTR